MLSFRAFSFDVVVCRMAMVTPWFAFVDHGELGREIFFGPIHITISRS